MYGISREIGTFLIWLVVGILLIFVGIKLLNFRVYMIGILILSCSIVYMKGKNENV